MSELRWNPLLREWVVTATHRQDRTHLPASAHCPLCPTREDGFPTEVPAGDYEIVVFENRFPAFSDPAPIPAVEGNALHPVAPASGFSEVVLYSPQHDTTLADQSVEQIHRLVKVWRDRCRVLGKRDGIEYVFIFENKGEVIGVTLSHPHGQIYALPFIPPKIEQELASSRLHFERDGRCLVCDIIADEEKDGRRIVDRNESFLTVVPFFARYPYEVHIYPTRHFQLLDEFTEKEERLLAEALKSVLVRYDNLFGFSFPYMMVVHQGPTNGADCGHYHFHIEFYPPHRTAEKIKYTAGCESGAGNFINDTLPEDKAAELRAAGPGSRKP